MTEKKIKTEIYSRISGYFRPVQNWNTAKKEEFKERKFASVNKIKNRGEKRCQNMKKEL